MINIKTFIKLIIVTILSIIVLSCIGSDPGWVTLSPKDSCEAINKFCPSKGNEVDGKTCEEQVKLSIPPDAPGWNKTEHNVSFGYGRNPSCISNWDFSIKSYNEQNKGNEKSQKEACEMLHSSCECGKLYGIAGYPVSINKLDYECNKFRKE